MLSHANSVSQLSNYPNYIVTVKNKFDHYSLLHSIKYGYYNTKDNSLYNFDNESKNFIIHNVCFTTNYTVVNLNKIKKNFAINYNAITLETFILRNWRIMLFDMKVYGYFLNENIQPSILTLKYIVNNFTHGKVKKMFELIH